ncbi:hypothetical protein M408DRAFT_302956 [Serendipita vermifera MAFF 305830]|uniref:Adenine DNA glycosylase n=1 Tax=Serendipita vermifera MAFF 305830 TaxID=933852 RepID=A0A0C2XYR1_SERVB|nr:hypothetical protein M408DRAFT_302956 [Serendipita vermifera MAFF 305830]
MTSKNKRKAIVISSGEEDEAYSPEILNAPHRRDSSAVAAKSTGARQSHNSHSRDTHHVGKAAAQSIQEQLSAWFDTVHDVRGMPWRRRWDPTLSPEAKAQRAYEARHYRPLGKPLLMVWVSEIMLQQTRVDTVIPYYRKWMQEFPTVVALSNSNIEAVNALWKGLGYYSRAARLFEGAKIVVQQFDGKLPDDIAVLQADIPGIGRYSAGAICSIAYGKCVPVLDGNVNRLLSRILALHAPPKSKATTDLLWSGAEAIVKGAKVPGAINQALIELGSTVCTPLDPKCGGCPVRTNCGAYQMKTVLYSFKGTAPSVDIEDQCDLCEPLPGSPISVTMFPMKVEKKVVPKETDLICIISWKRKGDEVPYYLLRKRPKTGLLAGLWDFPALPNLSPSAKKNQEKIARELVHKAFPQIRDRTDNKLVIKSYDGAIGSVLHVFSHVKKTFQVVLIRLESPVDVDLPPDAVPGDWMDDKQANDDEDEPEIIVKKAPKKRKITSIQDDDQDADRLKWVLEPNVSQEK